MGILRHPDFRRLWAADLLSQLGSRLSMGAIPLLAVLTLNASTLQVSLLRTCETAAWGRAQLPVVSALAPLDPNT